MLYPEGAKSFPDLAPDIQAALLSHRVELQDRAAYKRGNCEWWRYTWPLHREHFQRPRLFCPYRASENRFALDAERKFLGLTDTTVLYDRGQQEDLRYILGVLNSRVLSARFRFIGKLLGGGVYEYYENTVTQLPIPRRAPGDPEHDQMVLLVRRREEAAVELASTYVHDERVLLREEVDALDQEIERLVQRLFELSDDEMGLLDEQLS